ncbi:MAG: NADH-quinone oxidoreductase subunit N [Gammaproteobacteria bacterium]|nr:NADH-quinone oxidoreductase subunit N [Gammaproteobacteria bacterium]
MTITTADLLLLSPVLALTGTVVLAMSAIAVGRNYPRTVLITVTGLFLAAVSAMTLMPDANQQVTPLLIIDPYSLFFTALICLSAMFIAVLSYPFLESLDDEREEYFLLLGVATVGAVVLASSNHFVSALLGLETLSMSLYGMVAYTVHSSKADKYPLEASVKYLVLSAAASGFLLFGMALVYGQTGTLAFSSLAHLSGTSLGNGFSSIGLLLIIAGLAFKLSLSPFHMWTPDVYEGAPLPATTYLATIGKAAVFVVLLRFMEVSEAMTLAGTLAVLSLLAILSILAGNLLALLQQNVKRLLAYSSIAHMGYLLIAMVASYHVEGQVGVEAISFYLVAYVIMSLGAFGVTSMVSSSDSELDTIDDYRGLFWRQPLLAAVFTAMMLSLAGIPLTVGFIGKFYLFFAGVEAALWPLLAALIIGSGIGLYYYLRIIYRMLESASDSDHSAMASRLSSGSYGVVLCLFLLLLALGIYPAPVIDLIEAISTYV